MRALPGEVSIQEMMPFMTSHRAILETNVYISVNMIGLCLQPSVKSSKKKISKTNKKFCFILLNAKLLSNILYELFIDTREIIIDAAFALTLIFNR